MLRNTLLIVSILLIAHHVHGQQVVVTPEETTEILANPSMGWQTFHRTRTQTEPATLDTVRGPLRPLGLGYPGAATGQDRLHFLDGVLKETREAGQSLAFRVMCCSTSPRQPYHPKWLPDIGGKVVTTRYGSGPDLEVPVLDDPHVLAAHLDFIKRLGVNTTATLTSTTSTWVPGRNPRGSKEGLRCGDHQLSIDEV